MIHALHTKHPRLTHFMFEPSRQQRPPSFCQVKAWTWIFNCGLRQNGNEGQREFIVALHVLWPGGHVALFMNPGVRGWKISQFSYFSQNAQMSRGMTKVCFLKFSNGDTLFRDPLWFLAVENKRHPLFVVGFVPNCPKSPKFAMLLFRLKHQSVFQAFCGWLSSPDSSFTFGTCSYGSLQVVPDFVLHLHGRILSVPWLETHLNSLGKWQERRRPVWLYVTVLRSRMRCFLTGLLKYLPVPREVEGACQWLTWAWLDSRVPECSVVEALTVPPRALSPWIHTHRLAALDFLLRQFSEYAWCGAVLCLDTQLALTFAFNDAKVKSDCLRETRYCPTTVSK